MRRAPPRSRWHLIPGNDPVGGLIDQRSAPRTQLFCEPGSYEHGAMAPGPWIFSDGFESGDTAAWSTEVP